VQIRKQNLDEREIGPAQMGAGRLRPVRIPGHTTTSQDINDFRNIDGCKRDCKVGVYFAVSAL